MSLPSCCNKRIAAAVNCLLIDPTYVCVPGAKRVLRATFESPNPWAYTIRPPSTMPTASPGERLPCTIRLPKSSIACSIVAVNARVDGAGVAGAIAPRSAAKAKPVSMPRLFG